MADVLCTVRRDAQYIDSLLEALGCSQKIIFHYQMIHYGCLF